MVKKLLLAVLLTSTVFSDDVYERNCIPCHQALPTSLQQMFMSYLLVYSGEKNLKTVMKYYLRHPTKEMSVMSDLFIRTYGIKQKSYLSNEELDKAIDIYWDKFKVFNKLK